MKWLAPFLLGFAGLLLFGALSLVAARYFSGRGTAYEDGLAAKRLEWKAAADRANASVAQTGWKDEGAGLARVAAADYLPLAAQQLAGPEHKPRPMQGEAFLVPGTKTFEEMAARKAAATPAPAPAPGPPPASAPGPPPAPTPPPAP